MNGGLLPGLLVDGERGGWMAMSVSWTISGVAITMG